MPKGKPWTEEEDRILLDNYTKISIRQMCGLIPKRSYNVINNRIRTLRSNNIIEKYSYRKFSEEEDRILLDNYGKIRCDKLIKLLPKRKINSIRHRIYVLRRNNLILPGKSHIYNKWSKEEDQIIIDSLYNHKTCRETSKLFPNRTFISIYDRIHKIKKENYEIDFNKWTEEEIQIITENIGKMKRVDLLKLLPGRTKNDVIRKIERLRQYGFLPDCERMVKWTEEEDKIILENMHSMSYREIASLLPIRTTIAVAARGRYLIRCNFNNK